MPFVTSIETYLATEKDGVLLSAAMDVNLSLAGDYGDMVKVITGAGDLNTLEPGYYMRFISLGRGNFHLYGIEVTQPGELIVHENIKQNLMAVHKDDLFKDQLLVLNQQGKIYFRTANEPQGGLMVHSDLTRQYAVSGNVGRYHASLLSSAVATSLDVVTPTPRRAVALRLSSRVSQRLTHGERIAQIDVVLATFKEKLDTAGTTANPESVTLARGLLADWVTARNHFETHPYPATRFTRACTNAAKKVTPLLENDLGWVDFITNLLKNLANPVHYIVTCGRGGNFFPLAKTELGAAVDVVKTELKF